MLRSQQHASAGRALGCAVQRGCASARPAGLLLPRAHRVAVSCRANQGSGSSSNNSRRNTQPQAGAAASATQEQTQQSHLVLQQVRTAQAAAEAAQQQLFAADGHLGPAAQSNETLRSILETYSTVQRLYHKAMAAVVERHEQWADSPAGERRGWSMQQLHKVC